MLKRAAHWYSCVFLMHEVQEAAARDGSDAICGVNLTREVRVDDRGNVTGICDAEVISATELAEMIFGKHMLLRKAVKRARSVGVVVRDFIGGPCKTTEVLAIHTEPTVADSSAVAGIDGLRFGGPPTEVLESAMARRAEDVDGAPPTVLLCLGHARWGRAQLMNECLRGDWGVNATRATQELISTPIVHAELMSEQTGTKYVAPPQ